ncbi:16283_t:CDS:2 [Funneliformis mosseae]|uniref:16283_t:CDS:1 n=1 Tax=Funneliformis mosseae TaxID=27381 RepID=A0A9N8WIL1_FUNMO|nr:16283_t:CDS:2 [Funneliformis mosseae]
MTNRNSSDQENDNLDPTFIINNDSARTLNLPSSTVKATTKTTPVPNETEVDSIKSSTSSRTCVNDPPQRNINPQEGFDQSQPYLFPLTQGKNWIALIYLILWDFAYSTFCFSWVLSTFIVGIVSLIIPPLGYFLLLLSIYSWRMLGKLELLILNSISPARPSNFINPSTDHLPPRTTPKITQPREPSPYEKPTPTSFLSGYENSCGFFDYLFRLFKDEFTIRCLVFTDLLCPFLPKSC